MIFDFTKEEYERFKEELMLNDELSKILEMKIKGETIVAISQALNISESTVNRRVRQLKRKITKLLLK
jgi:DNA-binding NarL/FixJ family response regulator